MISNATQSTVTCEIINALRQLCPDRGRFYPLHEPTFAGNEKKYLDDCIDTGWVSSVGKYVDEFEKRLTEFTGVKRAIAVSNGTAALHICILVAGVEQNDEVLCPSLTFIATANAISYCNAIPHFIDISENSLGVDPAKLKDYLNSIVRIKDKTAYNKYTNRRIKALVAMHTFGHPVDINPLLEVCKAFHITLIEDAAESLGSYYHGVHTGNFGQTASLSFNGNKTITTGGGGAILTNDENLGKHIKHLTTTAKVPHKWEFNHDMLGYNYRMPNLNAALGCAQIENLEKFLQNKRNLARKYSEVFSNVTGLNFFIEPANAKSNYWLNAIILKKEFQNLRNEILAETNDAGIMTRPSWMLMHKLPMYNAAPRMDLTVSEEIEAQLINLPSSEYLGR
jgi:perosamine synthetase